MITSRVRDRGHFKKMIPRVTSHRRIRRVAVILRRTLCGTNVACSSLSTVTIARKPNLMNTLLVKIGTTGTITFTRNVPLMNIRRVTKRVCTGQLIRRVRFPLLSLMISNNRARLICVGRRNRFRIVKRAESSTTKRTCSGITQALGLPCPNNPRVSELTRRKGPAVRLPET